MRLYPRSLRWRAIICGLGLSVVIVYLALGTFIGKRLLYWASRGMPTGDAFVIEQLRDSTEPFHRDLARGHIKAGDSFDELITKYHFQGVTNHGEYCTTGYPGLCITGGSRVIAKNGRLVFADQDIGDHRYTYFNTLTPEELDAAETSGNAVEEKQRRQWVASSASVLGVAAIARRTRASEFPPHDDQP